MPYALKPSGSGLYSVVNTETGQIHAKHTSKPKAERQLRLLRGIEAGTLVPGKPRRG
jgi:hypothetical protein